MVRTAAPVTMTVTHADELPSGSSQLMVFCSEEGARVAISNNYQLIGTGIVTGGNINVIFGQISARDTLTVTITAFNCVPYINPDVFVMPPNYWLGYTSEWNNPVNWSNGIVPGPSTQVVIPEVLTGNYYPSVFSGPNPVIDQLDLQEGSNISLPAGVTISVGGGQ
jgi:hypothetical protein